MSTDRLTYKELEKRLAEAEAAIRALSGDVFVSPETAKHEKSEQVLHESEELYRSVKQQRDRAQKYLDIAGVIIVALNAKGEISLINQKGSEILGYKQEEIIGKNWFENFLPASIKDQVKTIFNKSMTGEIEPVEYCENPVLTKGDEERIIAWHNTTLTDYEGNITGTLSSGEDITERKKVEAKLRQSEETYRTLSSNIPGMIYRSRSDWSTEIISNSEMVCGYSVDDFNIQKVNWLDIIHPDDKQRVAEEGSKLREKPMSIVQEYRILTKDGNTRWVSDHKTSFFKEDGSVVSIDGIAFDVTEYKQAVENLRRESHMRDTLLDNLPCIAMVLKKGTREIIVSNEHARKVGAVPGKTCYETCTQRKNSCPFCLAPKLWKTGESQRLEVEYKGAYYEGIWLPLSDDLFVHYIFDITERKQTEAMLYQSEERFKQVVENAGDWIWEVDAEGLYTYANPIVERVLGYKPEEIVGKKHFYDFFASDVKEDLKKVAFEAFVRRESFKDFVNPNEHKNGSTVILETSGTPIIDEKGNLCGYRGADRDITERTQRENELRELNKQLVLASRRAGTAEVATDVLHNVGNVLNSINVSVSFIEDKVANSRAANLKKIIDILGEHTADLGTFLTEDKRGKRIPLYLSEAAKFILDEQAVIAEKLLLLIKNVEHLKQIIKAQQSYARAGGGEILVSVSEIIHDAMEINSTSLKRHGVDCWLELDELPKTYVDKQRVLQILVNLINNGKQALSENQEHEKLLTIRCYKHNEDKLRIEVADNGVGISKENMPKMFTYGFTTKKGGHGFGLHGSALAAKEMGGSLTVHSNGPGQGATFILELPFKLEDVIT